MRQKAKPDVSLEKMDLDLNIDMADIILEYTISNKPLRNHQANLKQLLSVADLNLYRSNYDISDRINLAKAILDLKLNEGVTKLPLIKEKLKETRPDLTEIISTVNWDPDSLNPSDCRIVTDWIEQRMQFYFFYIGMPDIIKMWETCYEKGFKFNQQDYGKKPINLQYTKLGNLSVNSVFNPEYNYGEFLNSQTNLFTNYSL